MSNAIVELISEFIHVNFVFDGSRLDADASLCDSGVIDSAGMLELLLFIEERFDVAIDDDAVLSGELDSITRLSAFVDRRRQCERNSIRRVG